MKKTLLFTAFIFSHFFLAQNNDCVTAIPICSNANITQTPAGIGNNDEGNAGCLNGENNSIWFTFSTLTAGTLTFEIDPVNNVDYDWALYGPNLNCTQIQTAVPLRCSYDAPGPGQYTTGLNLTSLDTSEDAGTDNLGNPSDGMVKYIDVLPGQVYYLLIDNFSPTISQFSLTFGGSAGLLTPFGNPALQPNPFLQPGLNQNGEVIICNVQEQYDFSTLSSQILNGNPDFIVKYYKSATEAADDVNAITTPILIDPANTYTYTISYVDPVSSTSFLNKCREFGTIKFLDKSFQLTPVTLTSCSNNNSGTAQYDLTSAAIGATPNLTLQYYPSMAALNAGTNEITIPYAYQAPVGSAYVKATNEFGCVTVVEIKLDFNPLVVVKEATLRACSIETNPSTGLFNLQDAIVTLDSGATESYYPSETDAINQTNEILNSTDYVAPNGVVYVRVMNAEGCYTVAKVTLVVIPPVYSTVLIDKLICIEDKTTLDAGPGFDGYEWSTGATTQVISNVGVGTYWVKLKTGECISTQNVKVYATEQPVVSNVEITNNSISVNVIGGTPAYQYSLDNVNWQDSNVFTGLTRGDYIVYVKDSYDCNPMEVAIVVPNIINVITPNGDGVNDVINYSALSGKGNLVLNIYDRYGTKIHQADKSNNYTWDGKIGGKNVPTGNYWYSVTWNENNKNKTPIKFSGWVMVKNRD